MADVPYSIAPGRIPNFLSHIQDAQVPEKVTHKYLESAGFTSKNDRSLIGIFKALGFLDGSGVPQERWNAYRHKGSAGAVLAQTIRECYSGLYAMYPDAHRKDDEAITNWIRSNTNHSADIVRRALKTFRMLTEKADFEAGSPHIDAVTEHDRGSDKHHPPGESTKVRQSAKKTTMVASEPATPAINVNVQLHLQASDDPAVYDAFFAAMKKHLLPDA